MRLLDIPEGSDCFLDANILCYHFVETLAFSSESSSFLQRIASGRIHGYASSHVISEAIHKIMLADAASRFGLTRTGLVAWLQRHRDRISDLSGAKEAIREIGTLRLTILPIDLLLIDEAMTESSKFGLLTNDSLVVALMRRNRLIHLATNDDNFDRVTGIDVWKPR